MEDLQDDGLTQIIVTHNFEEVLEIADRIVVLYRGEVADIVTPGDVDKETLSNLITNGQR